MKIYKKFNNNIVQTFDSNNQEMIVIGNGIGFNRMIGSEIDETKVRKKFYLQNSEHREKMISLLEEIPIQHFEVSERVIDFAEHTLNTKLHESVHLALADHISFAIMRYEQGHVIKNPLLHEIKTLYEDEYIIGLFALQIIKNEFGVQLPEDEAATIVTHIVNARPDYEELKASKIMKMVFDIVKLVQEELEIVLDEQDLRYSRFLTHLKFFAQRILKQSKDVMEDTEISLVDLNIKEKYPDAYLGSVKIAEFIEKDYGYVVSDNEISYLAIHLQRLL